MKIAKVEIDRFDFPMSMRPLMEFKVAHVVGLPLEERGSLSFRCGICGADCVIENLAHGGIQSHKRKTIGVVLCQGCFKRWKIRDSGIEVIHASCAVWGVHSKVHRSHS